LSFRFGQKLLVLAMPAVSSIAVLFWAENAYLAGKALTAIARTVYARRMTKRFLTLFVAIGLASICAVQAQSPSPGESPAKHRGRKKAETTAATGETAASPVPGESPSGAPKAKRGRKKAEASTEASPAESPAPAAAPKARRTRKTAEAAMSPSPSPSKFSLGDMFKPKNSTAASPGAVSAPARNASAGAAANPPAPGGGHGLVWVNTETHVYHKEGSRFYGTTKKGKYMTEAEAAKEGNRAAAKGE
jgi:hypothetical protein